jgi:DNA-binding phage protein
MNKSIKPLRFHLDRLDNLSDFSRVSGIPRRTLDRIKSGRGKPQKTTILSVMAALENYKNCAAKS